MIRVLFIAFGNSLHAQRRIGLFCTDPRFMVAVVSTHDYGFPNAVNVVLSGAAGGYGSAGPWDDKQRPYVRRKLRSLMVRASFLILRAFDKQTTICDIEKHFNDYDTVKEAVEGFRPDVIFLQTLMYPSYLALPIGGKVPRIITFWNGDVTWWAQYNGVERLFKKWLVTWGVRQAAAVTVNSAAAFDACVGYGAESRKLHLIQYPGVDLEQFRPADKDGARKRLAIGARHVILCPRGIGGYLNSDIIIKAAAAVVGKHPETLFLFLSGSGGYEPEELEAHRQLAVRLGIEENIRWEGQVSWEMMPAYYNASDMMVSMSSNDSLPNCMLESMACGVPVIMGDLPQIRAWVADGSNGCLVGPRDSERLAERIIALLGNENGTGSSFVRKNLERIRLDMDSSRNSARIKELVISVVRGRQTIRRKLSCGFSLPAD